MIRTLTRIYTKTKNEDLLAVAVTLGWITETEKQEIISTVRA